MKDMHYKSDKVRLLWALAGAALGIAFFLYLYGTGVLDPTNVEWMLKGNGDSAQHYLGWEFFRNSDLRLPYIGMSYDTVYPHRVSVLYSDSIPLLALLFKVILSVIPVAHFQYFGWWGLACFAMQGYFSQRIVAHIGRADHSDAPGWKMPATLLGAALFLLFPALTQRMFGHTALAGNWIILLALWLFLDGEEKSPTIVRNCLTWGAIGIIGAGFHMYYLPMIGIVLVGTALRQLMLHRGWKLAVLPILCYCATALAELFLLGAFSSNFYSGLQVPGYMYAADLLGIFIPRYSQGFETNLFLGYGVLLLFAIILILMLWLGIRGRLKGSWQRRKAWIISCGVIVCLSLLASLSPTITFAGRTWFWLPLPNFLLRLWGAFSSCARLAWVAEYLLLALLCGLVLRWMRPQIAMVTLTVCTFVQIVWESEQLSSIHKGYANPERYVYTTTLQSDEWDTLSSSGLIDHLAFASYNTDGEFFWNFAVLASENKWSSNVFYLAHMDSQNASLTIPNEVATPQPRTLYVLNGLDQLRRTELPLHYYRVDGYLVGSLEQLPLTPADDADIAVRIPLTEMKHSDNTSAHYQEGGNIVLGKGESVSGPRQLIMPGHYVVTVKGEALDHSYIHCGWSDSKTVNQHALDITFLVGSSDTISFEFYVYEPTIGWEVSVHTLDDTPVIVHSVTICHSENA